MTVTINPIVTAFRYRCAVNELVNNGIEERYHDQLISDFTGDDYLKLDIIQIQDTYTERDGEVFLDPDGTIIDVYTRDTKLLASPELLSSTALVKSTMLWVNLVMRKYFKSGANLIDWMAGLDVTKYSLNRDKIDDSEPTTSIVYRIRNSYFSDGGIVSVLENSHSTLIGLGKERRLYTNYTAENDHRPIGIGLADRALKTEIIRFRENESTNKIIYNLASYSDEELRKYLR